MPAPNLAGDNEQQQKLWRTYLFWARSHLAAGTVKDARLDIARSRRRLASPTSDALQAIIFTAVALEYRLRRTLESLNLRVRKRDTLGILLATFRPRLETAQRFDGTGPVRLPREWARIQKRLGQLVEARNRIVHGKHHDLLKELSNTRHTRRQARRYFNALVDAMRIINEATGRDAIELPPGRADYKALRVPLA